MGKGQSRIRLTRAIHFVARCLVGFMVVARAAAAPALCHDFAVGGCSAQLAGVHSLEHHPAGGDEACSRAPVLVDQMSTIDPVDPLPDLAPPAAALGPWPPAPDVTALLARHDDAPPPEVPRFLILRRLLR